MVCMTPVNMDDQLDQEEAQVSRGLGRTCNGVQGLHPIRHLVATCEQHRSWQLAVPLKLQVGYLCDPFQANKLDFVQTR